MYSSEGRQATSQRGSASRLPLFEHLWIPSLRPVLGGSGHQPVSKLPAATLLADLHRLDGGQSLFCRCQGELLLAEIPLALCQQHDIALPGAFPL